MTQLIVTRPRLGDRWDVGKRFDLRIDGKPAAPIGLGETIVIDLPPGPHHVNARFVATGSRSVRVETAPGVTRRLAVGPNVGLYRLLGRAWILCMLPLAGFTVWDLIDSPSFLGPAATGGTALSNADWPKAFGIPAALLGAMPLVAYVVFLRNHSLIVTEIPDPDLTVEQIAELVRARPFHARITIWHLMIAIALLALGFWISLEVFRSSRASLFDLQASLHANEEDSFRAEEKRWIASGNDMEKRGLGTGHFSKEAAAAAAKAEYHAAMKRKYAQAAASRVFSVEPDPSAPP